MAETLITIGIIGIVAAMTIPSLIRKFNHIVLENQFKKSLATAQQVINSAKIETGFDNFAKTCSTYKNGDYSTSELCMIALDNQIKKIKKQSKTGSYGDRYDLLRKDKIQSYNGTSGKIASNELGGLAGPIFQTKYLADGTYLGFNINELTLNGAFDINGPKHPNKLGYDIFLFKVNPQNDLITVHGKPQNYDDEYLDNLEDGMVKNRTGFPCSMNSSQKGNGIGCIYYALLDECPDNPHQKYFECLP